VAIASGLRGIVRGTKTLLKFWEHPARVFQDGVGMVAGGFADQPENKLDRLYELAENMDELSHVARLIAQRARKRIAEIREASNDRV
jgi:hypothetical protein